MIYTVTFNPSIDYIVSVDSFTCGETNRTVKELMFPGGKGINVSLALMNLGIESKATGFIAGFTGKEITRLLEQRKVDATKDLLMNVLEYHPFLIKPNKRELEEIFDTKIENTEDIAHYATILREKGAQNVLVSMAQEGALLLAENGDIYRSLPPKGTVKNSVGAGDSMVAGFLTGIIKHNDPQKAFYLGLCAGSASAFSDEMAKKEEIRELLKQFNREDL